jgi:hypothetical protein
MCEWESWKITMEMNFLQRILPQGMAGEELSMVVVLYLARPGAVCGRKKVKNN